jgi:subtilisin family serine protease
MLTLCRHQWADKWMRDLKSCMAKRIKKEDEPRTMPPVKIAILDTGVDYTHPHVQALKTRGVLVGRRGFVNAEEEDSEQATQDNDGHGTHIAWLIFQVAPKAQIYIAKISEGKVVSFRNNRVANVRQSTYPHTYLL